MSPSVQAAIFDLDGVITRTASLHAAAWKELFDDMLRRQAGDIVMSARGESAKADGMPAHLGSVARAVILRQGDPASVLLERVARQGSSVLALGWHGSFDAGRAPVLKQLLNEAPCALLLVRGCEESTARLKVGREIDED